MVSSVAVMSQPLSKVENMRALSSENIFSAPTARATSPWPERTKAIARLSAELLLAQAFSTLTTGMPEMPMARSATWPRIMCWPSMCPWLALAKKAACRSVRSSPASSSACSTARRVRSLTLCCGSLPKGVMPTPTT